MAPKDFVNIKWNYFSSHLIHMDHQREYDDDDEVHFSTIERTSSIDSLEQTDLISTTTESLHFIHGYHKWINPDEKIRVEKIIDNYHINNNQTDFIVNYDNNNTNNNDDDDDDDDDEDSIEQNTLMTHVFERSFQNKSQHNFNENNHNQMDVSLNHYDVQLQVNNGQLDEAIRYGVFFSKSSNTYPHEKYHLFKTNQYSQTSEMDMENGENHNGRTNRYSSYRNNNNNDQSYRRNRQFNDSSNNNFNANRDDSGSNPNRNNNNNRRSNDRGSEENDDDDDDDDNEENDDDDDDDDEDNDDTDETIARRLGFFPLDNETIYIVGRVRNLTNKLSFDPRDIETLESLIDQLINLQHLENYSKTNLKKVTRYLRLHRPLGTKSRALIFLQERIPRRAVKYNIISSNNDKNSNVFNIWRERERRSRLDSKDSLEDDGQSSSGQQLRDVIEINHPTPPVLLSNGNATTKVKQMAKDIDTRSISTRSEINLRPNDHSYTQRSSSPSSYPSLVTVAVYDVKSTTNNDDSFNSSNFTDDRLSNKRNLFPTRSLSPTPSEQSRVRSMINRLESTSNSTSDRKISIKKSVHDDHSDGSTSLTSSPPFKRIARRDNDKMIINGHDNINTIEHHREGFNFHQNNSHDEIFHQNKGSSNKITFELDRDEILNGGRRTASGTTVEEYVTNLRPGSETSVSMVRDVRARIVEDNTAVSRTDIESIPVKVDVETLYILEQKTDTNSLPPVVNIYIPDYEYNRSSTTERQDFGMQTITPTATIKPSHRPIGTQVESLIQQQTVAAQTTDSLHRPMKERQRFPTPSNHDEDLEKRTTTTTTTITRYEIKRRHSSHHTSEEEDDGGTIIYIDDRSTRPEHEENFQLKREKDHLSSTETPIPIVVEQPPSFGQLTSRLRIDQLRDINRHVVRRHVQDNDYNEEEHRTSEIYEIHTRGACKCLVVSYEEKTQYGSETRFEKQLQRIERTYTEEELKNTELHVIVTTSDNNYRLVKRDYGFIRQYDDEKSKQPTISIHYYTKEGQRMGTEHGRRLENLPLFVRCEVEYELNHHGRAQLIILAVTSSERRQTNTSVKKEIVDEVVLHSSGRYSAKSPELEKEINRQLAEPTTLLHLVDYSSRDDSNQTNSNDLRRVSRIDVTTSLRLVQRYRTIVHRLCQLYRSHVQLTQQTEQQRHLLLVARDEYYLLDLASQIFNISANISDIRQRQHDIFKREVNNAMHQPFDYAKYRRDAEQRQRLLEQQHSQRRQYQQMRGRGPPPPGHPSEAEFYLGSERRALIEREIHSMRESIRPHEHAPPYFKHEPRRRSLSISYSGGQRYVRARIIHVKDFYDENQLQLQQQEQQQQQAKEQELFIRVDDYVNESAANILRRSFSTDYLHEDGPRSRVRCIRIPGETLRIEEKTTHEYKGIVYASLPYSLKYWNILYLLDREARQGRPLGSSLPQTIVDDPYRQVIPPLTQQEIRQTAQQILSPQYHLRSHTDKTLRWFLSRDNRTEIESDKYLQTLNSYNTQQRQANEQIGEINRKLVTEKLVRYEKLPDRLVPMRINNHAQSIDNIHHRSPSISQKYYDSSNFSYNKNVQRSKSQPRPNYPPSTGFTVSGFQTPSFQQQQRVKFQSADTPLSRHQSVYELHTNGALSHPPSPSPSLHSLHSNHQYNQNRRPVAFNNRYSFHQQAPILTEIIDSQTGQPISSVNQEHLSTEVLNLLNKYNLEQF